jgi:protein tyrosine/serine phosphatase
MSRTRPPDEGWLKEVLTRLRDRKVPTDIHCQGGHERTGLIAALYQVMVQGKNPADVKKEMLELNFPPENTRYMKVFDDHADIKFRGIYAEPDGGPEGDLPNFAQLPRGPHEVASLGRLSRSAQPTGKGVYELRDHHVDVDITLREDSTAGEIEAGACKEKGIEYFRFPMGTDAVNPKTVKAVLDLIRQKRAEGKNVNFHCQWGAERTGFMAALIQLDQGIDVKQIHKDMVKHGFHVDEKPEISPLLKYFETQVKKKYPGMDTSFLWPPGKG